MKNPTEVANPYKRLFLKGYMDFLNNFKNNICRETKTGTKSSIKNTQGVGKHILEFVRQRAKQYF